MIDSQIGPIFKFKPVLKGRPISAAVYWPAGSLNPVGQCYGMTDRCVKSLLIGGRKKERICPLHRFDR